jgi:hypothetical protein
LLAVDVLALLALVAAAFFFLSEGTAKRTKMHPRRLGGFEAEYCLLLMLQLVSALQTQWPRSYFCPLDHFSLPCFSLGPWVSFL